MRCFSRATLRCWPTIPGERERGRLGGQRHFRHLLFCVSQGKRVPREEPQVPSLATAVHGPTWISSERKGGTAGSFLGNGRPRATVDLKRAGGCDRCFPTSILAQLIPLSYGYSSRCRLGLGRRRTET